MRLRLIRLRHAKRGLHSTALSTHAKGGVIAVERPQLRTFKTDRSLVKVQGVAMYSISVCCCINASVHSKQNHILTSAAMHRSNRYIRPRANCFRLLQMPLQSASTIPNVPSTPASQPPPTTTLPRFFVAEVVDAVAAEAEPDAEVTEALEVMEAVPVMLAGAVVAVIIPVIVVREDRAAR